MLKTSAIQNKKIGSIERVGSDGFIVTSVDPADEMFFEGKRLFSSFGSLVTFLMVKMRLEDQESTGTYLETSERSEELVAGGNGATPKPIALYEENPDA
jgi:hypothetical protein